MLLFEALLSPLCAPETGARLGEPADLDGRGAAPLLPAGEWPAWLEAAGVSTPPLTGPVFDSAALLVQAAIAGHGVALVPVRLFEEVLKEGRAVRPFRHQVNLDGYWLTRLKSRKPTPAMAAFQAWITAAAAAG